MQAIVDDCLDDATSVLDEHPRLSAVFGVLAAEPEMWAYVRTIFSHDPSSALARITVPLLAMYGSNDRVVPVGASVAALRSHVATGLLDVAILEGGDHRLMADGSEFLVDGYLDTVVSFVQRHSINHRA